MISNPHKQLSPDWNETQFTNALRDVVAACTGYSIKLGASRFMAAGTPDTIYSLGGFLFFLESKVYPYKPSEAQIIQLNRIRETNGPAWICTLKYPKVWLYDGETHTSHESILDALRYCHEKCRSYPYNPFEGLV